MFVLPAWAGRLIQPIRRNYARPSVPRLLIHVSELSAATRDDVSMLIMTRRTLIGIGLCTAGVLPAPASRADRERDHDQARRALERGRRCPSRISWHACAQNSAARS